MLAMPQVLEAAVIAMPNERWGERPLLIVVPKPGAGTQQCSLQHVPASMSYAALHFAHQGTARRPAWAFV
jgi:acyl-CoA synthetase (AMP-forming)/AMP-acid ligase II